MEVTGGTADGRRMTRNPGNGVHSHSTTSKQVVHQDDLAVYFILLKTKYYILKSKCCIRENSFPKVHI